MTDIFTSSTVKGTNDHLKFVAKQIPSVFRLCVCNCTFMFTPGWCARRRHQQRSICWQQLQYSAERWWRWSHQGLCSTYRFCGDLPWKINACVEGCDITPCTCRCGTGEICVKRTRNQSGYWQVTATVSPTSIPRYTSLINQHTNRSLKHLLLHVLANLSAKQ